ncbi:hypothetical protein [Nonomuraea sp. PA05]|uniref:hypothetical protein n=1 Tax=Nonomuraea sp. PA05 TaxID=2604466 RepID=UPI001651B1AC|nr:hypothetical protein [Nonomuraea sp. PA05]
MGGEHATGVIDVDDETLEDLKNLDLPVVERALQRIFAPSEPEGLQGFQSAP